MTTTNEHGSILFDVAKIKHSWDSPDSYGVDALWNQFKTQETEDHAKAYTFTRGADSVTITFKTFYRLMSKYRNCASKYNAYDVPMYTPEQLAAGIHARLWLKMDDNGKTMQIKISQPYLGEKTHTIPDESTTLAPAIPEYTILPCGWYAENTIRQALFTNYQITAVCFTTHDGQQVTICKKLLAAFLKPATGMHLEYRIKLDSEAYQMDAGTQSTYDGNKAITLKPLPASLRIEYRSQGYKGVARLEDSHLPPPAPSAVLTVYVPAVAHYTVAPVLDYQQPTMFNVVEEPTPIPIPEPATIPRDSDRATVSEPEPETIPSDSDLTIEPGDFIGERWGFRTGFALRRFSKFYRDKEVLAGWIVRDCHDEEQEIYDGQAVLCYKNDAWWDAQRVPRRDAPIPEPIPVTIPSDSMPSDTPQSPVAFVPPPAYPDVETDETLAAYDRANAAHSLDRHQVFCDTCLAGRSCEGAAILQSRIDALYAPTPSTHADTRPHAPSPLRCPHTQPQRAFWKRQHATSVGDSDRAVARPAGDRVRRAVHGPRPPPGRSRRHTCQCQTRTIGLFEVTVQETRP